MVNVEQWDLIRALASAYETSPSFDPHSGVGGEVFFYIDLAEDQFVRHPGLVPDRPVRAPSDMDALVDKRWIKIRERSGRSFTFVITPEGTRAAMEVPK